MMTPEQKEAILDHYARLKETLRLTYTTLQDWLIQNRIITFDQRDVVESKLIPKDKVGQILEYVLHSDHPQAFDIFVNALRKSNHTFLATELEQTSKKRLEAQAKDLHVEQTRRNNLDTQPREIEQTELKRASAREWNQLEQTAGKHQQAKLENIQTDAEMRRKSLQRQPKIEISHDHKEVFPDGHTGRHGNGENSHHGSKKQATENEHTEQFEYDCNESPKTKLQVANYPKRNRSIKAGFLGSAGTPVSINQAPSLSFAGNLQAGAASKQVTPCKQFPADWLKPKNYTDISTAQRMLNDTSVAPTPVSSKNGDTTQGDTHTCTLSRFTDCVGFGFKFVLANLENRARFPGDDSYYICHIDPNGTADRCHELEINDTLVSVNGVLIQGMDCDEVAELFTKALKVKLVLQRSQLPHETKL